MLFGIKVHVALDRNPGPGYNTLLLQSIPGDLLSACPHSQFHTLPGLLNSRAAQQTPTLTHASQAGRQFVPFLWWSLVWTSQGTNLRPIAWEADTLTTKPSRCVFIWVKLTSCANILYSSSLVMGNLSLSVLSTTNITNWKTRGTKIICHV